MSTYALAIPNCAPRPAPYGTRARLAVDGSGVEGYLALTGSDKRAGTASYALRIDNQSDQSLRARMTCATLRGESILAYPLDVHVAPFSISETLLPVRIADIGPYDRAIVHVEGGAIAFSLEAPAPARVRKSRRWIGVTSIAAAFAVLAAFSAAVATPRLSLLDAPVKAIAGTTIDVPYAFGGLASLEYSLRTPDGRRIAAGLVGAHEGTMHFSMPPAAGSTAMLSVDVTGPFGSIHRTRSIDVVKAPAPRRTPIPAAAQINAFGVGASSVHAGDTLRVNYIVNAPQGGELWLLDDSGQLWARTPLSPAGVSEIPIPQAAAGRALRVTIHVRDSFGDRTQTAMVLVLPGALAHPAAADAPSGVELSASTLAPGQSFTVTVAGAHGDAMVTLSDDHGNQVEEADIPADQAAVTMSAPAASSPRTYFVTVNLSQGVGQQTVVRKITVEPGS